MRHLLTNTFHAVVAVIMFIAAVVAVCSTAAVLIKLILIPIIGWVIS